MEVACAIWSSCFMLVGVLLALDNARPCRSSGIEGLSKERLLVLREQIDEVLRCRQ
jgi:hypothetical protein